MGTLPPPRRAREVQGLRVSGVQRGGGTPSGCLRPHSRPLPQVPHGPAPAPRPTQPSHHQNPLQQPAPHPPTPLQAASPASPPWLFISLPQVCWLRGAPVLPPHPDGFTLPIPGPSSLTALVPAQSLHRRPRSTRGGSAFTLNFMFLLGLLRCHRPPSTAKVAPELFTARPALGPCGLQEALLQL